MYKTLSAPITVQVELTSVCSSNCIHCYNHWRHQDDGCLGHMSDDILQRTLEELVRNEVFQVTFTGGEPMLRKKQLYRGIETLTRAGISCSVNSNLRHIDSSDVKNLLSRGVGGILTSLHSYDCATHDYMSQSQGAFDDTMRGIRIAMENGLKVAVSMVVTKVNCNHVVPTGLFLKDIGVTQFYATKASPPVNSINFQRFMVSQDELMCVLEDIKALKEIHGMQCGILECYPMCLYKSASRFPFVAERRCSAGTTTCTIGSDGGIRPCSHSDKVYGSIMTNGLRLSWNAMVECRDGSQLSKTCKNCPSFARCSGGCRVDAAYCNGKIDTLDPYADARAITDIEPPKTSLPQVAPNERFSVYNRIKFRSEEHGALAAALEDQGSPVMITHDTRELVDSVRGRTFSSSELADIAGIDVTQAGELCGLLLNDRVIVRVDSK